MRLGSSLSIGPLITLEGLSIHTIVDGMPIDAGGFVPLTAFRPTDTEAFRREAQNAKAAGIAHLAEVADFASLDLSDKRQLLERCRLIRVAGGRLAIELAFVADLDSDLHPPGRDCFESYELLPLEVLLTPDAIVRDGPDGLSLICAFAFVSQEAVRDGGLSQVTVRVGCRGRPGMREYAEYVVRC